MSVRSKLTFHIHFLHLACNIGISIDYHSKLKPPNSGGLRQAYKEKWPYPCFQCFCWLELEKYPFFLICKGKIKLTPIVYLHINVKSATGSKHSSSVSIIDIRSQKQAKMRHKSAKWENISSWVPQPWPLHPVDQKYVKFHWKKQKTWCRPWENHQNKKCHF